MSVQLADLMFGVPVVVVPEVQVPVVFREPRVFRILDEEPEVEAVPVVAAPAAMCQASRRRLTGYSFQTGAERQRRFARREQELRRLRDEDAVWVMPSRAVIGYDDSLEGLGI